MPVIHPTAEAGELTTVQRAMREESQRLAESQVSQTMTNSPGGLQIAAEDIYRSYGLVIQHSAIKNFDSQPKVEVSVDYNGEVKEMTYAEFFSRLGFEVK